MKRCIFTVLSYKLTFFLFPIESVASLISEVVDGILCFYLIKKVVSCVKMISFILLYCHG